MNSKFRNVVITGSVAYDEIMDFPGKFIDYFHPKRLHQINISFVVNRLEKQLGGIATNISYNLSLMTKVPVFILAAIGRDGQTFINFFAKHKIKTSGIFIDKKLYTATGKVMTDKKDNQIWAYYYGALVKGKRIDLKKYADKNSLVIISSTHQFSFLHHQKQALELGLPYLYDPGMSLTWIRDRDLRMGVRGCQWLVGNDYEIAQILKRLHVSINQLIKSGVKVIITLGERGVTYFDKKNILTVRAYKIKQVVDPTGAGDAWRAGFIAGIVEQKSLVKSLKLGNALASFAIESYGTVNHRIIKKNIYDRMRKI